MDNANFFIIYRRDDRAGEPGRNYDRLNSRVPGRLFMDVVAIEPGVRFRGDKGDFLEVAGNLLDNACPWCDRKVRISIAPPDDARAGAGGMQLTVADDGPGIPDEAAEALLQRGMRLDESTPGHGIGLAVVKDIAKSYGGTLSIGRADLGGAEITVSIPPIAATR